MNTLRRSFHAFWRTIHEEAKLGHTDAVMRMLDRGANINQLDRFGETPLMWSCFGGHVELARLLVERGADVNVRAWAGSTALHLASDHGSLAVVRLVVESGANLHEKDDSGRNALHRACLKGHREVADYLLGSGLKVDEQTARGNTPVALAAEGCHVETVRLLIMRGAELNDAPDFGGWTALHRAASAGNVATARLLLEAGADVNIQNKVGATPLHIAVQDADETSLDMVDLLLSYGASRTKKTIDRKVPAQFTESEAVRAYVAKRKSPGVPTLRVLAARAVWRHHLTANVERLPEELREVVEGHVVRQRC